MNAENGLRPKKKKESRNVPKKRRDVPKKHTQLENDVLADPLGVRGSNLVQKKGMNAENGLRPKRYSVGYPHLKIYSEGYPTN